VRKVDHYVERAYSPLRVLHPLRRTGAKGEGSFEQVSWDNALAEIAARLRSIIAESGPTAMLPYSFAGTQGLLQANGMARRILQSPGREPTRAHGVRNGGGRGAGRPRITLGG
jgi:anaerobic selenocysteine-containing dehydrogenase